MSFKENSPKQHLDLVEDTSETNASGFTQIRLPHDLPKLTSELLNREKLIVQFPEFAQLKLDYTHEDKNKTRELTYRFYAFLAVLVFLGFVTILFFLQMKH